MNASYRLVTTDADADFQLQSACAKNPDWKCSHMRVDSLVFTKGAPPQSPVQMSGHISFQSPWPSKVAKMQPERDIWQFQTFVLSKGIAAGGLEAESLKESCILFFQPPRVPLRPNCGQKKTNLSKCRTCIKAL